MPSFEIIILSFASFLAGFVDAIAGGGGVVIFPVFLFLGLPVSTIVSTNKIVSTFGTSVAAYTFYKRGKVTAEVIRPALPWAAAGALSGAVTILLLPNEFLKPVVSILIIAVALYCFFRPNLGSENKYHGLQSNQRWILFAGAFGLAFYDGFFGPGTGIFLTFFFIQVFKFDFVGAAGNTKILNLVSNFVSLLYFLTQGTIRFDLGIPMAVANVLGGYLGARTAISRGSAFVKWLYIIMAAATAAKLLLF
jgi:uncharacterized membrane protein YfcA